MHKENLGSLTTKKDIPQAFAEFKTDLIKWTFGIVFTISTIQAAVIISIIKFIH